MIKRTIALHSIIIIIFCIFAQIKGTSDKAMPENGDVPALSESQSCLMNNPQSQAIEKRYEEYRLWFIHNVYPLSQEAEKRSIQATQEEIAVQEKAFNAMFPGMPSVRDDLCSEILARKYSKTLPGACISTGSVHDAYTQLQSEFSNEAVPQIADVQPMLEMRALAKNRSVQIEIEKCNEQNRKEYDEIQKKSSETWPISDLMIYAPDDHCLAQYEDNDSCLLTVGKFNKCIQYVEVSKLFSIDAARRGAIQKILRDFYIADDARKRQAEASDAIAKAIQDWKQWKISRMKYKEFGAPVRDSNSLHEAYAAYYDALFSERRFPYFSIIGSSDSLYIDSILQALQRDMSKIDQGSDIPSKAMHRIYSFPWSYSRADLLPEEFDKYIDTMHAKDISGIIKMPYGFFIVRFDSMQIRPARQFEEVQEDLVYLATKRKWKNLDSLLAINAYRIYDSNKRLNQLADTMRVIAFLTPAINHAAIAQDGERLMKVKHKNTLQESPEKGLTILSTQLPLDIRNSLFNRFEASNGSKRMLGPVTSRYGIWNFKILDIYHGNGVLPFSFSKKRLVDSMLIYESQFTPDAQWQKQDSALDNIALAESYAPVFLGFTDIGKEDWNNATNKNANFNADANAENDSTGKISEEKGEKNAELGAWLLKVSILYGNDKNHKGDYSIGRKR
jgi:hypothetical protein